VEEIALCWNPVATSTAVTSTPDSPFPEESQTVPVKALLARCAQAGETRQRRTNSAPESRLRREVFFFAELLF
jgi:hypothetical protein